jgi:hypothetical protein
VVPLRALPVPLQDQNPKRQNITLQTKVIDGFKVKLAFLPRTLDTPKRVKAKKTEVKAARSKRLREEGAAARSGQEATKKNIAN